MATEGVARAQGIAHSAKVGGLLGQTNRKGALLRPSGMRGKDTEVKQMAELACRECGRSNAIARFRRGCPACAERGALGLLEVSYAYNGEMKRALQAALERPGDRSLWRFRSLLPLQDGVEPATLGEGSTPLIAAGWLSGPLDVGSVYLKNETANPTWCSKDRANTVSVSVGRALGARGMTATTTGNHGTSMVAYCARAGIPAIALCSPFSDVIHRAMIASFGGTAIVSEAREAILRYLVDECDWFPATSMGNAYGPNPFGVEGVKTIAYEIYEDLQDVPDAVYAPVASGDLLYGVYKGFRELMTLGFTTRCPRMIGCQAEGAAPLAMALRDKLDTVPVLPNPTTVAYSVGDATGGKYALDAVVETGGDMVTVSDPEIMQAQQHLAANGLLVEAASATTLAGLAARARVGLASRSERVVCLLTGAGIKWSAQLLSGAMGRVVVEPSLSDVAGLASSCGEK